MFHDRDEMLQLFELHAGDSVGESAAPSCHLLAIRQQA
jgi:hypothetical protein